MGMNIQNSSFQFLFWIMFYIGLIKLKEVPIYIYIYNIYTVIQGCRRNKPSQLCSIQPHFVCLCFNLGVCYSLVSLDGVCHINFSFVVYPKVCNIRANISWLYIVSIVQDRPGTCRYETLQESWMGFLKPLDWFRCCMKLLTRRYDQPSS